ncbi:PH domain-containing protein [Shewanella indica]|uniref:PH domain-containing protein n=1 Tax=Shewanella indica TaxID=768528 RepID=A0ABU4QAG9_9GAMM|nr:PH domain-containing protein [Shewanella indica]MCE9792405.1 PH domain-containing protein [Shewanella indica]MDX6015545.1 PH domain-containing protein [Shewanella indica]
MAIRLPSGGAGTAQLRQRAAPLCAGRFDMDAKLKLCISGKPEPWSKSASAALIWRMSAN